SEVDADFGYTVLLQLKTPQDQTVSALFQSSAASTSRQENYLALYGTKGTLWLTGPNSPDTIQHFDQDKQAWQNLPLPQRVIDSLPQVEDIAQRDWNQLFRDFVADVRGEQFAAYPTFRDGWVAAEIMEIVRGDKQWTPLP